MCAILQLVSAPLNPIKLNPLNCDLRVVDNRFRSILLVSVFFKVRLLSQQLIKVFNS